MRRTGLAALDDVVLDADEDKVIEEFLREKEGEIKSREFKSEKEVSNFFYENYGLLEWVYIENSNQMQALKKAISDAKRFASEVLNRISALENIDGLKKEIMDYLMDSVYYYHDKYILPFEVMEAALNLKMWGSPHDYLYYYTRDEDILKAQDELWKKMRDVANEYGLDKRALWDKFVEHAVEELDEEFQKLLAEKGFPNIAVVRYYQRKYGFEDPKSGFIILFDEHINLDSPKIEKIGVVKKFIEKLDESELESLRKMYSEEAKDSVEFEAGIENFVYIKDWELKQICLEESKGVYKRTWELIETVKEMRKRIAEYLSSVDVENWVKNALIEDKNLKIYADLEKLEKLHYGLVVRLLRNELEVAVDFITQDGLYRELSRFLEDNLGFKPTPEGYRLELGKKLGQNVSESERKEILERLNRGWAKTVYDCFAFSTTTAFYTSIDYDEKLGFVLNIYHRFFEEIDLLADENVINKFIEKNSDVLRNTKFRSAKEVSGFIDDNFEALERVYIRSCNDVWRLKEAVDEFIANYTLDESVMLSNSPS